MKTKKIIISVAIILVVLIGVGLSVGLTYSLWSDTSGGDESVAPSVDTNDYNAYTKYLLYNAYNSNGDLLKANAKYGDTISGTVAYFECIGLTEDTLLSDLIFPTMVKYNGTNNSAKLKYIKNTIFTSITFKTMPTRIVIPASVEEISQSTFAGLTSLQSLVIYKNNDPLNTVNLIKLGYGAFANCTALKSITVDNGVTVDCMDMAFAGCSSLTSIVLNTYKLPDPPQFAVLEHITSMSDEHPVPITLSNWATYKASIFPGTPSGLTPVFSANS